MNVLPPSKISEQFAETALKKATTPWLKLSVLGFMGGAYVAFGFLLAIIVGGGMPGLTADNPGLAKFLMGAVFPVGLIMVVLAGAELFTSSCAVMTSGSLMQTTRLKGLFKVWGIGYFSNFIGAVFVAYFLAHLTGVLDGPAFQKSLFAVADAKLGNPFYKTFIKGIGANWLVCLAVWQAFAAKDALGKMIAIWFPVMAFVTIGFEHSIANMFVIPAAIFNGADITWGHFITSNLIPATLGNIVGGVLFVGMAYSYVFPAKKTYVKHKVLNWVKKGKKRA